jgi:hypothetical protein
MNMTFRLRLDGDRADEWREDLTQALAAGAQEGVTLSAAPAPRGLQNADPATAVALVAGAFSVFTTLLTCACNIYLARRKERKSEDGRGVRIVIRGVEDSVTIDNPELLTEIAIHAVGEVREILLIDPPRE